MGSTTGSPPERWRKALSGDWDTAVLKEAGIDQTYEVIAGRAAAG